MSGKGNCYDNAAVETFFKTTKAELIWRRSWVTWRQAEMEKLCRLRTKVGLNELLERHQTATGPANVRPDARGRLISSERTSIFQTCKVFFYYSIRFNRFLPILIGF